MLLSCLVVRCLFIADWRAICRAWSTRTLAITWPNSAKESTWTWSTRPALKSCRVASLVYLTWTRTKRLSRINLNENTDEHVCCAWFPQLGDLRLEDYGGNKLWNAKHADWLHYSFIHPFIHSFIHSFYLYQTTRVLRNIKSNTQEHEHTLRQLLRFTYQYRLQHLCINLVNFAYYWTTAYTYFLSW